MKESNNLPDLYYRILDKCSKNQYTKKADIAKDLNISESHFAFKSLQNLKFIALIGGNNDTFELLPEGFSTYLSLSSQKQSNNQARKATILAIFAIGISLISFIASIVFNIFN